MNVILDHIETVGPDIETFWFRAQRPDGMPSAPDDPYYVDYVAGQFTELYLPHQPMDDRGARRWFTLSSSPSEPLLGITTKFATTTVGSSFKRTLRTLPAGTPLQIADPMGDFVLPKDRSIPLVFVAGGLGITPIRSMTKWMLDREQGDDRRDITLIYGAHTPEEMAFRDLFAAYYDTRFIPIAKHAPDDWTGLDGDITTDLIREYVSGPRTLVYLAGPEPMVERFVAELTAKGIDHRNLVTDYFPGYAEL